jgi:catechol 2,3-dioxygenase-like lactoylglutathione lyase family enzyme
MTRGLVDFAGLADQKVGQFKTMSPPPGLPFTVQKIGHVVLKARDLARSVAFYTQVLGFRVTDAYPESMMPGGMVFMRLNADHHGVALIGDPLTDASHHELHHMAFEVATLDEVFRARDHLRAHKVPISFEGRRRAGCQIAVEFTDPDGHCLEIYWGLDQIGTDNRLRPPEQWRPCATLDAAVADAPEGQDTSRLRR